MASTTATQHSLPPTTYEPRKPVPVKKTSTAQRIVLSDLTPNNIGQLRMINSVLFPVRFSEKWYKDVLSVDSSQVCKFALFNDIPVANVCCRFDRDDQKGTVKVYIMTLGCLAPYRRLGIASKLLNHVLDVAGPGKTVHLIDKTASVPSPVKNKEGKDIVQEPIKEAKAVDSIFLHVQTGNDEAKAFYEKHGFTEVEMLPEYYKIGIEPRSAWLLEKMTD
ncbi:hypothetical protein CBS101457_003366 [Exobasidium rhododendri]|nr:hypothetical protein CBS101457_003366 [Exobasidium rhododendri]